MKKTKKRRRELWFSWRQGWSRETYGFSFAYVPYDPFPLFEIIFTKIKTLFVTFVEHCYNMSKRLIQYIDNLPDDEFKKRYLNGGFLKDVRLTYDAKLEIDNYVESRASKMILRPDTNEGDGEIKL